MGMIKLNSVTMERALVPGSELELEYELIVTNVWMVSAWLASMEPKLEKEEPLWQYLGYRWEPDTGVIVFRLRLRQYQMDIDTREIIPLDPVTLQPVSPRKTPYYASGHFAMVFVGAAALIVAGCTWLSFREMRLNTEAVLADPTLTPEQKAAVLSSPTVAVGTTAGVGLGMVGLALIVIVLWRWFR